MSIERSSRPGGVPRREFLYGLGSTLGSVALTSLLADDGAAGAGGAAGRSDAKKPHHPAKAKACIFLYMEGGPSHIDTFDPKPRLAELDGKEFHRGREMTSAMYSGNRRYVASPFGFRQTGQSGLWMCNEFRHLAEVADDLCLYRGCQAESINHPTANLHMNTGNRFGGDPAIGSWVNYGLGTANDNLPGFFVLPDVCHPQGGAANWSNGFLPAHFQATPLRSRGAPILNLQPPEGKTRRLERGGLDFLAQLEAGHRARHPGHELLESRMRTYELAFRMQAEVPGILDLAGEEEATLKMYGIGQGRSDESFARRCLLARRLVEQGVRFVQVYSVGWDSHDDLKTAHGNRIRAMDQPVTALIRDLKQRGLLEQTLIVWCGEFGRSPDNAVKRGRVGRDHNPDAMSILMAGGGTPAGCVVGATDEIGARAVEVVHPLRDFHVTLLHLLGLDDNKLTYFHGGRFKQLSQTGGQAIRPLVGG